VEPIDLLQVAARTLDRLRLPYAVTGSMASITYGEPRYTNDIDIVVALPLNSVAALCREFPEPDFYVSPEAAAEAVRNEGMFNVLHPASGLKVDLIVAKNTLFGRSQLQRGRRIHLNDEPGGDPVFCSPEDIILSKLEFYREGQSDKHVRDITGMLKMTAEMDRAYIETWAARLGVDDLWRAIVERVEKR
jgi:hypothetical protein